MDQDLRFKTGNTMYHCDDCDLTVHGNDRENHLNGNRHKYRTRQKNGDENNLESPFQCGVCHSKFTNIGFYTVHMGSKTHKRNLRRTKKPFFNKKATNNAGGKVVLDPTIKPTGRRVPIQGIEKYITLDDLKESSDYKSTREKYRPRNNRNQQGHNKTYISSVTAYWAVTLALDPTVRDFKISVNEKDWGDFGDAVIEIQYEDTEDNPSITTTFAIQFKHISNNVKSIDSLSDGRFDCTKYIKQISKIKGQNDSENKKFVIFTTANTEPGLKQSFKLQTDMFHKEIQCPCNGNEKEVPVIAKTLSNRRKLLVNTSDDNESIYFFFSTDNMHVIPKLYIYTRQKKLKNLSRSIDDSVNNRLEDKRVEIHREFIKYIEYWSEGFLGGNYRLKKEDVLVKLGHLLLFEFKVPPQIRVIENQNYGIWNQAVNSVDVTVLTKHPVIIFKICMPINLKIEEQLGLKIDTTTSTLKVNETSINNIQNSVLKMYLFEETLDHIDDDIPLEVVYDIFWKAGLIPMILQVKDINNQYHVLEVISLLKSLGLTRRYFLITSDQNIKTSLRYYKSLTSFVSLDDVVRKLPSFLLDYVKISVTDKFSISLKTIQDSDLLFQKGISANEFFDMSLGKYSFKPISSQLARREHGVEDVKLVLNDSLMIKLNEEIESKNEVNNISSKKNDEERFWLRGINPEIFY